MKNLPYGEIDRQASPTNVSPMPASRGNSGRAMGDIDDAASPQAENAPQDPGVILGRIGDANFGGINSIVHIGMEAQCPGSTVSIDNASFNDDVAQYQKADHAELNRIRNQAFNMVDITQDNTKPPFTGRQDSDPQGG